MLPPPPIISVIIPCYNQGKYLSEAVSSVLASTLTNWECVIVNDGSTDDTESVGLSLASKDSRIHYFYEDNAGLPHARNYAIQQAKGKYILPLDSDDKIALTYLEKAVNYLENHPDVSLYYCNIQYFGASKGSHNVHYRGYQRQLIDNSVIGPSIYRRQDWQRVGGYDETFRFGAEDWEFWIRLLYPDKKVYKTEEFLHFYRQFGGKEEHLSNVVARKRKDILTAIFKKHIDKYFEFYGAPQPIYLDNEQLHEWADRRLPRVAHKLQNLAQKIINWLGQLKKTK